ncbi:solute carrier organic anion transporter family member 74D-like [Ornithodoros turicata]|uniref:solute carrier organic anion transporter family member 74D-like n=1 Tax=Ornithodoros turicata TaxID=34597 RepID=UPI003139A381
MLDSTSDSVANLLPPSMNVAPQNPGCSYRTGSSNATRASLYQKPAGTPLQRRPVNDIFPETETMFPLLSDGRYESSMSNHAFDSPPELSLKSSAKSPSPPIHWRMSKAPAHSMVSDRWRTPQEPTQKKKRSLPGGFLKRIFWGTPRKYFMPPETKDSSPEQRFSDVIMRYHKHSPQSILSADGSRTKRASQRLPASDVIHSAPPPTHRKKKITPNDRKMVYAKILQDALNNQDPNTSALVVTPDPETGTMFALRLFGPSAGFFLSSYCLSHYENPYVEPMIEKSDPRWVGAWWMGYMLLGLMAALLSTPLLLFPRRLVRSPGDEASSASKLTPILPSYNPEDTDGNAVKEAVKRLLKNPQFLCQAAALSFIVNGLMGFLFAMPKYMETQFRKSASTASLFSGSTSLVTMLVGVLFGGAVIRKVKPKANWISAYIIFVDVFLSVCFFGAMFLGCRQLDMAGTRSSLGGLNLLNKCNGDCGCTTVVFQPVCDPEDDITYFSPCFAGCKGVNASNSNQMLGCRCVQGATEETPGTPDTGICFSECSLFVPFVAVLCLAKTIFATSRVGTALIEIRSVHQKDKTVALTLLLMLGSIFGFVPYPLVYGAIMDSCCLIWNTNCGAQGNCWLYDADKFRYTLHGTSMGFVVVGAAFNFLAYTFRNRYVVPAPQEEDDDEDVVFMRNMGHPGMTHSS